MASLGEKLKEARLKQGLSLNEIAGKTRIQAHLLEAIESDDLQKIPGDFFRKSFVRQYAETLGLNPDEFETTTEVHFGSFGAGSPTVGDTLALPDPPDLPPLPTAGSSSSFPFRQVFLSLGLLIGVLAVCAVAYMSWEEFQSRERNSPAVADTTSIERPAAEPEHSEPTGATQAEPGSPNTSETASASPSGEVVTIPESTPSAAAAQPVGSPAPSASAETTARTPLEPVTAAAATAPETTHGSGPSEIRLSASALTWVRVRDGEKIIYMGTIDAGQSKIMRVSGSAQILTGNAGGLNVVWQGSDVGKIGPVGQVRTVFLTPEGVSIQAPAPKTAPEGRSTSSETASAPATPAP
ncbi:MAG: DUF4115 domain-containing protein [Bryobacterales bacterium]|nr:DUF4115 domain-containing protein [Bryobacterales bacterium]